jgi:hypothetical protein
VHSEVDVQETPARDPTPEKFFTDQLVPPLLRTNARGEVVQGRTLHPPVGGVNPTAVQKVAEGHEIAVSNPIETGGKLSNVHVEPPSAVDVTPSPTAVHAVVEGQEIPRSNPTLWGVSRFQEAPVFVVSMTMPDPPSVKVEPTAKQVEADGHEIP